MNKNQSVTAKKVQSDWFARFAAKASHLCGSRWAFLGAISVILLWGVIGPMFHYSDTWQLVINTGTTIVTFLMVFLIQNTQNRDARAINLKLDEIIRAITRADNTIIDVEKLSDEQLDALAADYEKIHNASTQRRKAKSPGTEKSGAKNEKKKDTKVALR